MSEIKKQIYALQQARINEIINSDMSKVDKLRCFTFENLFTRSPKIYNEHRLFEELLKTIDGVCEGRMLQDFKDFSSISLLDIITYYMLTRPFHSGKKISIFYNYQQDKFYEIDVNQLTDYLYDFAIKNRIISFNMK